MKLKNKVAVITGAGSGIGRASARIFAAEGAKVVVADRTEPAGEEIVAEIKAARGEAIFVRTDVSHASMVENMVNTTLDRFGKIDILYNNAAVLLPQTPVEDIEESSWDHLFDINVKGIFLTVKYVVPAMKKAGGGVIINTASLLGLRPSPLVSPYVASKGAVISFSKSIALELASFKIRVNCILPTLTATPMIDTYSDEIIKAIEKTIPLGRMAMPEDMAYAALYLASHEASMVTGTCLTVDGGEGI